MAEKQQTGNNYSRRLPAFVQMYNSMYEEQEESFKQKFKSFFLSIGNKIYELYNGCIESIKNCSCYSNRENINYENESELNN